MTQSIRTNNFPIVGIGSSAGGLEALEVFFKHLSPHSGMAFVLVSHLAPNQSSALAEILQRVTLMSVTEAQEQMPVEANHVYVIPPNQSLSIFQGVLQLNVPEKPPGQRMLIDTFLRSLAEDQTEHAIGIVLSGTGSDGTLGLKAILDAGGISFVQEPNSAKFDGMPASAIKAGYANYILPVEEIAEQLSNPHLPITAIAAPLPAVTASSINRILMQLRSSTGHDFSLYKKSTVQRRIERRMAAHNIDNIDAYARYLKENLDEVSLLFKELLINVTHFFRDPEAFAQLQELVLPLLFQNKGKDDTVRVWVAGCASGEEAYSIAMLLNEFIDEKRSDVKVQVYATDLDNEAIAIARAGIYPANIVENVNPERLHRFFSKEPGGYRIKKNIREMVIFAVQNLIKDPPFTKLDFLSCRNVMIYLEPELQNRLLPTFHYALRSGGVLFLSPSESIGNFTELFHPLNRKWKLYQANSSVSSTRVIMASNLTWRTEPALKLPESLLTSYQSVNFAELCKRGLLQFYAPASVLTDLQGNVLYVYGETGKYLRPAPGQASLNVIEMAREGLPLELRLAIHNAALQGVSTFSRVLSVKTNGHFQPISFQVRLLSKQLGIHEEDYLLISFHDAPDTQPEESPVTLPAAELRRIEELQNELIYVRKNLQRTIEEHNAANEESKCAHEEMQSTNEELQSTNEELETSKEELQSINEELVTVNSELQAKIVQLSDIQNDMKNLFDNIRIGIIFLDCRFKIRRFTREAAQIYRLVDSDIGRLLSDIKSDLQYEELLTDAQNVLDTLIFCERKVVTHGGVWFDVRIQPYRTLENVIDGVVITFSGINAS